MAEVQDWLTANYGHLNPECRAAPGLQVTLTVPHEKRPGGWYLRIGPGLAPLELTFEILAECFTDLDLALCTVQSVHMT